MTALKQKLINYISNIPDEKLLVIQPLLFLFYMESNGNKKDNPTAKEVPIGEVKIKHAPRSGPGMISPVDFLWPRINTLGWKFNREEANERR